VRSWLSALFSTRTEFRFADDDDVDQQPGDPPGSNSHGTSVLSNIAAQDPGKMFGPAFDATLLLARTEDVGAEYQGEEDCAR
jgi:hypothetical protein